MAPSNIRDLLTAFNPSLDLFAITSGDGRIKIWDTVKGQVQTEFTDIVSEEDTSIFAKRERGHLSVDYTCMKWFTSERKKKRKLGCSLLVLGTGGGDVLALDVAAGQSKWRVTDCHAGRVSAISFARSGSSIYTAGADGMICEIDSLTGNLLGKFKASTKAISSMSVSADGKIIATAAAQMKILNLSDHKKIQKFSGHPGAVRCMIFTENGKYILSSAVGERYIAVWNIDGGKKQSASAVLAMEHPAVFLDSRCIDSGEVGDAGLYVLAISEVGVCYFWFGKNAEELRNAKPTKISVSSEDSLSETHRGSPAIFAAILQGIAKSASGQIFVATGLPVKPSFQKLLVHSGTDIKLSSSRDGVLLPISQSLVKSKRGQDVQNRVVALDRANAEDALLPIPKIFDSHEKKKKHEKLRFDKDEVMADLEDSRSLSGPVKTKDGTVEFELDTGAICMEDRLRSLGILSKLDDQTIKSTLNSAAFKSIDIQTNMPQKKMRAAVLSMVPSDTYKLLGVLVAIWQTRSSSGNYVLPWIYSILVNHSHYVMSEEPETQVLSSLFKVTKSRKAAIQPLLQLSGRLQLVVAQIDKATNTGNQILLHEDQKDESEDEDEDVNEIHFREEDDDSEISSDDEQ
ncbi:putative transcription factor WD40-like family [Rosa chinensis]|uniref:Putative transcription factor WD40-like family n=1 Tax=Rosa chinensis TaxID=74649 RepID=A0A2P6QYU4_ROSCH|nr:WD repeat-containing protein 43 [Rosa chinensis]XP_024191763.1 WD repeat-containing protein 43 [Rosa chinensis]PRQ39316.1 putative transcription factor WD40-like family [Rosa chinensis]